MSVLTWVVVSYGGVPDAVALIESLAPEKVPGVEMVVACNRPGDADAARDLLADRIRAGGVRIVDYRDNPGYLPAVARVLASSGERGNVVFSNADLVGRPETIPRLLYEIRRWPSALSLAPAIIGARGHDVNPHLESPPSARRLRLLAGLHRFPAVSDLLLLRPNGHGSTLPASGLPGQLLWAGHGSCVVLSGEFFSRGGELDYPFALFGEELWVGSEVMRLGGEVRYVPDVRLEHREHAATGAGRRRGWVARVKYGGLRYWANRARLEGWK
jgi:GT2 family glycosyltransferase